MLYGISISPAGPGGDPAAMAELAVEAEQAGWDGIFLEDYIVYQGQAGMATYDPWVTMAAMAAATSRVCLGASVTPLPRRRPWKLASEAVTLDHLSNGRLILGVGAGDIHDQGFSATGEPLDPAVDRGAGHLSRPPFPHRTAQPVATAGPAAAHPGLDRRRLAAQRR